MERTVGAEELRVESSKIRGSFLVNLVGFVDTSPVSELIDLITVRALLYPEDTVRIRRDEGYVFLYARGTLLLIWPGLEGSLVSLERLVRVLGPSVTTLGFQGTALPILQLVSTLPNLSSLYFGGPTTSSSQALLRFLSSRKTPVITTLRLLPPEYGGSTVFPRQALSILPISSLHPLLFIEGLVYPLATADFLMKRTSLRTLTVSSRPPLRSPTCHLGSPTYVPLDPSQLPIPELQTYQKLTRDYPGTTFVLVSGRT